MLQAKAQVAAIDDLKDLFDDRNSSPTAAAMAAGAGATSGERINRQQVAAQGALDAAEARLEQLRSMPLPADLTAAQAAVDAAKANVMAAEYRVDQMKRGATAQDIEQAEAGVSSAEAAVVSAEARLQQMMDGPTAEDLVLVNAAVLQAEQALAMAERPFQHEDLVQANAGGHRGPASSTTWR